MKNGIEDYNSLAWVLKCVYVGIYGEMYVMM